MIKSVALYFLANILPQSIAFLLLPIYSLYMSLEEFGIISALETVTNIFMVFVSLNLYRSSSRFYFSTQDQNERRIILGTFFWGSFLISLIFCGIAFISNNLLTSIFPSIPFWPFYALTILTVIFTSLPRIILVYYQVSEQPSKYLKLNVLKTFLILGSILLFVVYFEKGALGQIIGLFTAALILAPICFYIAWKQFDFTINWTILREGLSFSWPFIPTLLMSWVLSLSDRIFIERMLSLEDLGIYGMGYKISSILLIISGAISLAYSPQFYKIANEQSIQIAKEKIKAYSDVLIPLLILFTFALSLFAWEIVTFSLDEKYLPSLPIIRIILLAHLLSSILSITSNLYFYQAKKTFLHMLSYIFACLIKLILNYFLILELGLIGAAIASVISAIVLVIIHYNLSRQSFFIAIGWPKILSLILICSTLLGVVENIEATNLAISLLSKIIFISILIFYIYKNSNLKTFLNDNRKRA